MSSIGYDILNIEYHILQPEYVVLCFFYGGSWRKKKAIGSKWGSLSVFFSLLGECYNLDQMPGPGYPAQDQSGSGDASSIFPSPVTVSTHF